MINKNNIAVIANFFSSAHCIMGIKYAENFLCWGEYHIPGKGGKEIKDLYYWYLMYMPLRASTMFPQTIHVPGDCGFFFVTTENVQKSRKRPLEFFAHLPPIPKLSPWQYIN